MSIYTDELKHYGILGMKWGVRRYQNADGTLTPEGKKRYGSTFQLKGESYYALNSEGRKKYYNKGGRTTTKDGQKRDELDREWGKEISGPVLSNAISLTRSKTSRDLAVLVSPESSDQEKDAALVNISKALNETHRLSAPSGRSIDFVAERSGIRVDAIERILTDNTFEQFRVNLVNSTDVANSLSRYRETRGTKIY